jgi:hypothetical protein
MLPADKAVAAIAVNANILVTENFMGFSYVRLGTCVIRDSG